MSVSSPERRLGDDTGKPGTYRGRHGLGIGLEAVIPRHFDNIAVGAGWRDSERVALALDDERRDVDRVELGQATLRWLARTPRWMERERQAEDCDGGGRLRGAAGDTGAERAAADNQLEVSQLLCSEMLIQAASSCAARAGERRPATRYGCSTSATLIPAARAARDAAARSGASIPPPAPWPSTSAARCPLPASRWARAGP